MKQEGLELVTGSVLPRLKWEYEQERTSFKDLLCFGTADMDYKTPEPILSALRRVVDGGHLGYVQTPDAYYEAIGGWLFRKTGWKIDVKSCIGQNVGIYMSAFSILEILTKPGDRIAILTPVHFCFKRKIQQNGRVAIECPLRQRDGVYEVDMAALDACLGAGCKMLWLCNPHNPVGRAWSRDELQKIAALCIKHNVFILSDDVYCGLLFPGTTYTPIASLSRELSYRTVTMYSTSKCYNTTGLRHSFLVTENPEIMKRYQEHLDALDLGYGKNIMGIAAAIAAYNECDGFLNTLMEQIQKNHRFLSDYLETQLPGCAVSKADSTYFLWADFRALGINPQKLSYLLEQEAHIVVENGVSLGKGGAGFIRINLATSEENLQELAGRLKEFWQRHQVSTK